MAIMRHVASSLAVPLCHHTRVGRSSDADICIDDRRISSEHAVIVWNDGLWMVKDLGSRNGTVVDGKRLEPGSRIPLRIGTGLRFGSNDAHWILESDRAPDILAMEVGGDRVIEGEEGLLRWRSGAMIVTEDGKDYWFEETGVRTHVSDRQVVEVGGVKWRLSVPPSPDESGRTVTAEGVLLSKNVTLEFQVSPDEEHVQLRLLSPGVKRELRARSFDYMLLALARARMEDANNSQLAPEEQGWVYADQLAKDLGMDVSHVNVDIYRARRRFADAGIQDGDQMLQRRTQTRALRLGCGKVAIH